MNRFRRVRIVFSVALALAARGLAAEPPATRPNFVVVLVEAQGWANTSVAMDERVPESRSRAVRTPAVERLAREGLRFAQGYAASPRCTPSRAALLTGRSPAVLHMTYVGAGKRETLGTVLLPPTPILELPASETTVAELLHAAGYATAHFGKWHLGRVGPEKHGFDASDGPTGNGGPDNVMDPNPEQARGMTARGIAFMERAVKAGRPFYLQVSHYPNQGEKARRRGGADEDAAVVDATVVELLAALDRLGVAQNTYVIYTSDHGAPGRDANEPLSGGKGAVTEGGLRVPFLIRGPGIAAGACSLVPVTAMDVLPTIAELARCSGDLPRGVEGGSLVALLRSPHGDAPVARARAELVFHFPHYDLSNGGPATALIAEPWKLIWNYEAKSARLYNLRTDPAERHDLATAEGQRTQELAARLSTYLREVHAQMPQANPNYDPKSTRTEETPPTRRNGGAKGGRNRNE